MITKKQIDLFEEKIKNANSIVIMGHKNPDGDALCSVIALARLIEQNYGKNSVCVYDGNIPDNLDSVPLRKRVRFFERIEESDDFDVAIVLDYGTIKNIGGPYKFIEKAKFVIEIDHHIQQDVVGNLAIRDERAAATAEVVYELICAAKLEMDITIATLLMTAIITDTGWFAFVKRGRVFEIAAKLVDFGVKIQPIMNGLDNKARKTIITESAAAANAEFLFHNKLAIAIIDSKSYKNLDGRGDTVLGLLQQVAGLEYIVLLKEQKENQIGVSLRSKTNPVDKIANELGGGGHKNAAGAVVCDSLENVKNKVIELFKKVLK